MIRNNQSEQIKTININQVSPFRSIKFVRDKEVEEYWREASYLHVLGVITNAVNKLCWLDFKSADTVDSSEKWEFVFHALCFEHNIDLSGSDWTLNRKKKHLNLCKFHANSAYL